MIGRELVSVGLLLATAFALFGCFSGSSEYSIQAPKGHVVSKIWRSGAMLKNEQFDVAMIYGFNDNETVAEQIAEFLNQAEPNTYSVTSSH